MPRRTERVEELPVWQKAMDLAIEVRRLLPLIGDAEDAIARELARSSVAESSYFAGIWDTNVIEGEPLGVPWYVDTRLIFYRRDLFARAGYDRMPVTWDGWRKALVAVKRLAGRGG